MSKNIIIERTSIQWKSPVPGTPTRRVPDHYYGRTIHALVDGGENVYRLKPDEIPLEATEEDMISVIEQRLIEEEQNQEEQQE
ncbi:hypothetical protein AB4Y30_01580 [Ornithinibacillus sp. 4-3]|uniref:Uncharacterized protein n=1 Tax=Ornithinibacillus sp. 4-3 TaxID=3231488 RepID=A0AB39HL84_9BACI